MDSWREQRKIVAMPGAASCTPEVVLARTLEKARAGKVRGVIVAISWEDGSAGSDYSNMRFSDALYALHIARHHIDGMIFDEDNQVPEGEEDY